MSDLRETLIPVHLCCNGDHGEIDRLHKEVRPNLLAVE